MTRINLGYVVLVLTSLLNFGCEKNSDLIIISDQILTPYIDSFLIDASRYGIAVKYEGSIVFVDSLDGRLDGNCIYRETGEGRSEITIDRGDWDKATPAYRKFLIYHELGHCALGLAHRCNDTPLGQCSSIMLSSDLNCKYCFRDWQSDYMWEQYLKELFTEEEIVLPQFLVPSYLVLRDSVVYGSRSLDTFYMKIPTQIGEELLTINWTALDTVFTSGPLIAVGDLEIIMRNSGFQLSRYIDVDRRATNRRILYSYSEPNHEGLENRISFQIESDQVYIWFYDKIVHVTTINSLSGIDVRNVYVNSSFAPWSSFAHYTR
ncbi:MAG: hypothetical protein AB8F78_02270 [Saprospiraceae bacterium]